MNRIKKRLKQFKQLCVNDRTVHGRALWIEVEALLKKGGTISKEQFAELHKKHSRKVLAENAD
ncbi:MAG: hypothetical protein KAS32_14455 [Candidatus Peribacteraceae bacterium]|nr:hypothetical protein [Candidatus Peribacteraceae bacterium]